MRGTIDSQVDFMTRGGISIPAIQETHIRPNTSLKPPSEYSIIHADRPKERGKGSGLAFLLHQSVQHWVFHLPIPPGDKHVKQQAIIVRTATTSINIANVHCPPAFTCISGFKLSLQHLLQLEDALILRDINVHSKLWNLALPEDSHGG